MATTRVTSLIVLHMVQSAVSWQEASVLPLLAGDPDCWSAGAVPNWTSTRWPKWSEGVKQFPALFQRMCCSAAAGADHMGLECWQLGYGHARCCTNFYKTRPSPVHGRCPEGYAIKEFAYDPRNDDGYSYMVSWNDAFDECSRDPGCCGVAESLSESLNNLTGHAYSVGSCNAVVDKSTKTCHKVVDNPPVFDGGPVWGAWNSPRVAWACCAARPLTICLPSGRLPGLLANEVGPLSDREYSEPCKLITALTENVAVNANMFETDCFERDWYIEALARYVGRAPAYPSLRIIDLAGFALRYFNTGILAPEAQVILERLDSLNHNGIGINMCAPAAILANILRLERRLHRNGAVVVIESVMKLELLWSQYTLPGRNFTGPTIWPFLPPNMSTSAVDMIRAVTKGFGWLRTQIHRTANLRRLRRQKGFTTHMVLAVCMPLDARYLENLHAEILVHFDLRKHFVFFIYDVCYELFHPGSSVYTLENVREFDLADPSTTKLLKNGNLPHALQKIADLGCQMYIVPLLQELMTAEIASILYHFERYYDNPPDFVLHLHPDAIEHVDKSSFINILNSLSTAAFPNETELMYLGHRHNGPVIADRVGSDVRARCRDRSDNAAARVRSFFTGRHTLDLLNPNREGMSPGAKKYCMWIEHVWELVFERPFKLKTDDYGGYDFAQFLVRGDVIRNRPRAWWGRVWRALVRRQNYVLLPGTRHVSLVDIVPDMPFHRGIGLIFEHYWHLLFFPHGHNFQFVKNYDRTIPLALQTSPLFGNNPSIFGLMFQRNTT